MKLLTTRKLTNGLMLAKLTSRNTLLRIIISSMNIGTTLLGYLTNLLVNLRLLLTNLKNRLLRSNKTIKTKLSNSILINRIISTLSIIIINRRRSDLLNMMMKANRKSRLLTLIDSNMNNGSDISLTILRSKLTHIQNRLNSLSLILTRGMIKRRLYSANIRTTNLAIFLIRRKRGYKNLGTASLGSANILSNHNPNTNNSNIIVNLKTIISRFIRYLNVRCNKDLNVFKTLKKTNNKALINLNTNIKTTNGAGTNSNYRNNNGRTTTIRGSLLKRIFTRNEAPFSVGSLTIR